jgi:hypothetical protein
MAEAIGGAMKVKTMARWCPDELIPETDCSGGTTLAPTDK